MQTIIKQLTLSILAIIAFSSHALAQSSLYKGALTQIVDHVNGETILSDTELQSIGNTLVQNIDILATDIEAIERSFEAIDLFEETNGALFTTSNTRNGINRAYTDDNLNLHRNMLTIHQGLIDHSYTETWLKDSRNILEGRLYKTSSYFPGAAAAPADPLATHTATVKCSYMLAGGTQPYGQIGNDNVVRPTGSYLAPGSIAEIEVPAALVGRGLKIRVGAHFWDLKNKSKLKRLDRVSILYDINETKIKVANPLGGGIYLEIPLGIDEGLVDLVIKNTIRSPFYSAKSFDKTTLSEWQNTERLHDAPWADFETDKFMIQVPTSFIYAFDDPETLMKEWDSSMDAVSDLLGRPLVTDRHKNYLQFDVVIRGSAYHPGYPMSNYPYNPNIATNGTNNHKIFQGPQFKQDIHFHELGHEVAISKFYGEQEALVNFLYIAVLNQKFDYSLEDAFAESFGPSYNFYSTKDNTTRTRLVANTFREGISRNTCGCPDNEVRYQTRGYAHYVDIVDLFGWEALEKFWKSEGDAADAGNPFIVNNQPQDDRIFRMSQAAGVDLRPIFHFWGLHPTDPESLEQRMADSNLALPLNIKEKLENYLNLTPSDYDRFVAFAEELYPGFLNYSGNQFAFGAGWYKNAASSYDESTAEVINQRLTDIIDLYYTNVESVQSPYLGTNHLIPGLIEGEHYDLGGEGLAFHDDDKKSGVRSFRPEDNVDFAAKATASNGFTVGYSNSGEWLEYSVDVTQGTYDILFHYYANSPTGALRIYLGDIMVGEITDIINQGNWQTQATASLDDITLAGGANQILRLEYVNGARFDIDAVEFVIAQDEDLPTIESLTLVNADTDEDIAPFTDGYVVDFAAIGTSNLSVRANVSGPVESVIFGYNDNMRYQTENVPVYALAGNFGINYLPWTPSLGENTITATSFSENHGKGIAGNSTTINFTVLVPSMAGQVTSSRQTLEVADFKIYPNPAMELVSIAVNDKSKTTSPQNFVLEIVKLDGSKVRTEKVTSGITKISVADLSPGIYHVFLIGETSKTVKKLIVVR